MRRRAFDLTLLQKDVCVEPLEMHTRAGKAPVCGYHLKEVKGLPETLQNSYSQESGFSERGDVKIPGKILS